MWRFHNSAFIWAPETKDSTHEGLQQHSNQFLSKQNGNFKIYSNKIEKKCLYMLNTIYLIAEMEN